MTKQEFLYKLRDTLSNALSPAQVEEHVRYYENYIDEQISLGYSEDQVISELGDGWSIAHNIIDGIEEAANGEYQNNGSYQSGTEYVNETSAPQDDKVAKLKGYAKLAIALLIIFIILIAVTRLIIWALPTIIMVAVVVWIIKKINGQ